MRADAPARVRWSCSVERSIARRAWSMVAGASPRTRARPARYISIAPGRRRSSPPSTTTIPAGGAHVTARSPVGCSHRSTSRSRSSTPSNSPPDISAPMKPAASTGLTRTTSSGMASSQPRMVASCLLLRSSGIASSTRSAARSASPAASAWRIAWDGSPLCSNHWLARRCRAATRSGCSSSRWVRRTSAKRWGSGTSGGCRRAGPRTGSRGPATRAWPSPRAAR